MAKNKIDTTPSTVATNALQALPFGNIIGGPLSACIEAQAKAARSSWEFIQEVGLKKTKDGRNTAVYVNFDYRKNGRLVTLSVPLLSLVPIPYMAIKDIEINFKANISAASSVQTIHQDSTKTEFGTSFNTKLNLGFISASTELRGSISSKKDSTATRDSKYSVENTMDINVRAGQDDMPAGMAKVLEMLNESIDSVDRDGELQVSEQELRIEPGKVCGLYATYKNEEGFFEPTQIIITDIDSQSKTSKCKVTYDETGAICLFTQPGTFLVKAGKSRAKQVLVSS